MRDINFDDRHDVIEGVCELRRELTTLRTQVESLSRERDEARAACVTMRNELRVSDDLIGEIHAWGDCDCRRNEGYVCIPCQCGHQRKPNLAALVSCDCVTGPRHAPPIGHTEGNGP